MSLPELEDINVTNDIINSIYKRLDKKITITNIMYVMKDVMVIIEEFKGLKGLEKKQIVIDVLTLLVYNHGGEYKNDLSVLVRYVVPEAIDLVISASKNKLLLNVIEDFAEKKCCLCF
jgi:hypothetical protein